MAKYKVEVTDQKDQTNIYDVKIKEFQKKMSKFLCRKLVFAYIALVILCGIMGFSFFCSRYNPKKNINTQEKVNNQEKVWEELSESKVKFQKNIEKQQNDILPIICMTIFCSVGIVFVCLVIMKDDGGIRFAKLNELHNLREEIKHGLSQDDTNDSIEVAVDEKTMETINCDISSNTSNSVNINNNYPILKTVSTKNLKAEFLKNYMNSIVEI